MPGLSLWEAALLAAILTPTDAALGQAVVASELVPLAGGVVGLVGAVLVARCYARAWMAESAEGMIAIGLAFGAFGAFGLAELAGGNGFIAAFVAGLTFGNTLHKKCKFLYEFAES